LAGERKSTDAFEATLKRELRSALPWNAEDCPVPEVLAAYYDRSLSRGERAPVDSHLTSCVRCQSMMASIARADEDGVVPASRGIFWLTRVLAPVAVVGIIVAIAIGIRTREQPTLEQIALASPGSTINPELQKLAQVPRPPVTPEQAPPSAHALNDSPATNRQQVAARGTAASPANGSARQQIASRKIAKAETVPSQAEFSANVAPAAGAALSGSAPGFISVTPRIYKTASPDGSVVWHFGSQGVISRSENSAPTRIVRSGMHRELLAGSAPSNDVCWMVGKSGAILRTLDRGAHWQIVKPPLHTDFTSVSATDSNNATVTALYRHNFVTHDGGVTWSAQ
jgi:hypothetical protein